MLSAERVPITPPAGHFAFQLAERLLPSTQPSTRPSSRPPTQPSTRAAWSTLAAWSPALILGAFAAATTIVPTRAEVAVTDDWVYYRTVETLLNTHQLRIHEMSSAALLFQAVWGAAFAAVAGLSFAALRVSTLVLVAASGLAVYALCRDLGAPRGWAAVCMAAYLFHPLTFSLAYTFMTDPHFTSLLVISAWCYVHALRGPTVSAGWLVAGSIVAACAALVRQQGLLIPVCVAGVLLLQRRPTTVGQTVRRLAQIGASPAAVTVVYAAWLRFVHGLPWALRLFADELQQAGWDGIANLIPRLAVIELVYLGLFVLPLAALILAGAFRRLGQVTWAGWLLAGGWMLLAIVGALMLGQQGRSMPYAPQFFTITGLGPDDVLGGLPPLVGPDARLALTIVCVLVSSAFALALAQRSAASQPRQSVGWWLLLSLALGQAIGALIPSVHFAVWDGTLDRYLLPLLPLALILLVGALRGGRQAMLATAGAVLIAGCVSVAGTRDYLTFLDSVWSLAREANAMGIANTSLDAGAGWDGLQLYEQPPTSAVPPRTPNPAWWIQLFAPLTDSSYVVTATRLPNYAVVDERDYFSWLRQDTQTVYLLRRPGVPEAQPG